MPVVTLSSKGQLVVPRQMRDLLKLQRGDLLDVTLEDNRLVLTPLPPATEHKWQDWRGRLAGTDALERHVAEHAREVSDERVS